MLLLDVPLVTQANKKYKNCRSCVNLYFVTIQVRFIIWERMVESGRTGESARGHREGCMVAGEGTWLVDYFQAQVAT
jgi:hypothetical protein